MALECFGPLYILYIIQWFDQHANQTVAVATTTFDQSVYATKTALVLQSTKQNFFCQAHDCGCLERKHQLRNTHVSRPWPFSSATSGANAGLQESLQSAVLQPLVEVLLTALDLFQKVLAIADGGDLDSGGLLDGFEVSKHIQTIWLLIKKKCPNL